MGIHMYRYMGTCIHVYISKNIFINTHSEVHVHIHKQVFEVSFVILLTLNIPGEMKSL